jgi:hypothetical protein
MKNEKFYTRKEAEEVVKKLLSTAAARKNELEVPNEFIAEHPWTLKYLSHFAEANDFLAMAKTTGVKVAEEVQRESIIRYRREHGMRQQIVFTVTVPEGTNLRTKVQRFTFELFDTDKYRCING